MILVSWLYNTLYFPKNEYVFERKDIHYIDKKVLAPLLMNGLTTLVISMNTNLNV